jgi:hypothetical protein
MIDATAFSFEASVSSPARRYHGRRDAVPTRCRAPLTRMNRDTALTGARPARDGVAGNG